MENNDKICDECRETLKKIIVECTDGMFRTVDYDELAKKIIALVFNNTI